MQIASESHILALDVGEKRVGVAVANSIARLPRPLVTLENSESIWDDIAGILEKEKAGTLVVGLPRGLDGQATAQTEKVKAFGETLQQKLDIAIHWQDEAVTSRQAEEELTARHGTYDKGMIDALAATYILEDYLRDNPKGDDE